MTEALAVRGQSGAVTRDFIENSDYPLRQGIPRLLAIKDSDVGSVVMDNV